MQPVPWRQLLIGVEMEPALAARVLCSTVPGDAERLQAAAGERDQILLQRIDAECVGDLVVVQGGVRTVGAHHEAAARAEEGGNDAKVLQRCIREIAEHGALIGLLHGARVMRASPAPRRLGMAAGADLTADILGVVGVTGGGANDAPQQSGGNRDTPPGSGSAKRRHGSRSAPRGPPP
jgi:hypothetical protein